MSSQHNAERFLASQGLDLAGLRRTIPPMGQDELLMLIGSVPDGLANPLSDIDLLVVGARQSGGDLLLHDVDFEQTVERLPSSHEINVEYWTEGDLLDLADKFKRAALAIEDPAGLSELIIFNEVQLRLIHCIINGVVLCGNPEKWHHYFKRERLINYLVIYFISFYYTLAEDANGQVQDGDFESALANLRQAVDFLAGAEVAACGETNPYTKWRIKLLRRCETQIGAEAVSDYLHYLFPPRDWPRSAIAETIGFCESRIGAIFERRPQVIHAAVVLSARMRFVTSLDA